MTAPTTAPDATADTNPYVGPRSLQYGERIYGRDREIEALKDVLVAGRVVLLYSPSGAGKSSLIEAGLRPELEQRDFRVLPTVRVGLDATETLPASTPVNRYLFSALLSLEEGRDTEDQIPPADLTGMSLDGYLNLMEDGDESGLDPILVFDQFEELLTLDPTDQPDKEAFVGELGIALRNRGRWALISMREDFVTQLDPYLKYFPTRLRTRYRLDLLGTDAAKIAARRPAEDAGVPFSEEAADRLIDDLRRVTVQRGHEVTEELGPYVEPVQLQVVCRQLWNSLWR